MAEDLGDKTELPTQRRMDQARESGQLAKSMDLIAAVDLVAAALLVWCFGSVFVEVSGALMRESLAPQSPTDLADTGQISGAFLRALYHIAPVTLGCLSVIALITLLAHIQQVRFLFTTEALQPKLERLNPVEGFQRLFARRNFVRSGINLAKLTVVILIVFLATSSRMRELSALPMLDMIPATRLMVRLVLEVIAYILALLLVLGVSDYLYQRWQHTQDLKMTKQQMKDERKETDGDPDIKHRIQKMGRDIAMGRLKRDVPTADVIVTNPTHFAIALKYDSNSMAAPKVIAKGADFMAFRIREIAIASRVPIVEKPELARALYKHCPVGRPIDSRLFQAVAEVLAYVYRLQGKAA